MFLRYSNLKHDFTSLLGVGLFFAASSCNLAFFSLQNSLTILCLACLNFVLNVFKSIPEI